MRQLKDLPRGVGKEAEGEARRGEAKQSYDGGGGGLCC